MLNNDFVDSALSNFLNMWSLQNVSSLAKTDLPSIIFGRRKNILRGDINEQWVRWFIESIADPLQYVNNKKGYIYLFKEVFEAVKGLSSHVATDPEIKEMASVIARIISKLSKLISQSDTRRTLNKEERRLLLDISDEEPACWICGARFSDQAIDQFLCGKKRCIDLPEFVDILKPRGLNQRDLSVEVDHVMPFSKGGSEIDNLKLSCGWCNLHKYSYMSIYDVNGQPRLAGPNNLGLTTLPQPFWVVRLLAVEKACEHKDGCRKTTKDTEMTIEPIRKLGALNPSNLRVICYEHDSCKKYRLQPRKEVEKIWKK